MSDVHNQTKQLTHIGSDGRAHMVDVGSKAATHRAAVAEAIVRISPELAAAINADSLPKGNLIEVVRLAGISAAKRTDELIPLCHSLPLDYVDVRVEVEDALVRIVAEARTQARTGVEMEALTAVSVAALTVIDMGKAIDKGITIQRVQLVEKRGGRSGHYVAGDQGTEHTTSSDDAPESGKHHNTPHEAEAVNQRQSQQQSLSSPVRAAVLTISDRCSRGESEDFSGPAVQQILAQQLGAQIKAVDCVPDEIEVVCEVLQRWSHVDAGIDLVVTTGSTGLAQRDIAPEAAMRVIQREHSGVMELARARCASKTPLAYLSRGVAGAANHTFIVTLPGSMRGAVETLEAMLDVLPHAIEILRGEAHDHGEPAESLPTGAAFSEE